MQMVRVTIMIVFIQYKEDCFLVRIENIHTKFFFRIVHVIAFLVENFMQDRVGFRVMGEGKGFGGVKYPFYGVQNTAFMGFFSNNNLVEGHLLGLSLKLSFVMYTNVFQVPYS
eukprot:TRINITY_DN4476_c0_g1_i8.p14 TRINITY_DN4476_c0_g1~~TRINITY_DN4476_c0_g1_i8.p14  ORF type:complete len:113 (-),score=7.28 TRINITY_DN4476_c0_g1_i8:1534-1872(-)